MNKLILALALSMMSSLLQANDIFLKQNPTAWRLQNYIPDGVVIWFSGSSCANGQLTLPVTATTEDKNRLWSTVMAAKVSGREIYVYYDTENTPGACMINSFGLEQ